MLFSNPANHQRRLAISSSFTYSKRNNLGLHLKSRKSQKQLFLRSEGWLVVFSIQSRYSRVLFISEVAALRCERHTSGDLVTSRQFHNSSLQKQLATLRCERQVTWVLFISRELQNSIFVSILEVAPLWCERHTFGYFKTNLYFSYSEAAALRFCVFQENSIIIRFQKQLLCGVKGGWQLPTMNFRFLCNSGSCIAPCE